LQELKTKKSPDFAGDAQRAVFGLDQVVVLAKRVDVIVPWSVVQEGVEKARVGRCNLDPLAQILANHPVEILHAKNGVQWNETA